MLKSKQQLIINNSIELGENISDEAKGKGRIFISRFIEPGVAHYEEFGDVLITKETLDKFIHTMVGCPVIIKHKDIDDKNADEERVGVVSRVWFNEIDGWYYCEGIIWNKQAIDLVKNQDWSVSCTYDFDSDKQPKTHNGKNIDMEFTGGEFLHLALVPNPRYERANIVMNSKESENENDEHEPAGSSKGGQFAPKTDKRSFKSYTENILKRASLLTGVTNFEISDDKYAVRFNIPEENFMARKEKFKEILDKEKEIGKIEDYSFNKSEDKKQSISIRYKKPESNNSLTEKETTMSVLNELESFVKGIIKNAEDEKEKEEAKNEDKRKLIDEVGGILKGKVDDEIIRTIIKKMEEASYEPSEDKKADNEADKEEKEEKFEEEKEIANKKAKNEEEKKEDKKESENEDEKEKDKDDEVDKEEVKNKCKNSMDDVKKIVMGGTIEVKSEYISKADRFALGENY